MNLTILISVAAVVLAPLLGYLGVARKLSGKVETSEAAELWNASREIRAEYREENTRLRTQVDQLDTRLREIEISNERLVALNAALQLEITTGKESVSRCLETNDELRIENAALKARVDQLERLLAVEKQKVAEAEKEGEEA